MFGCGMGYYTAKELARLYKNAKVVSKKLNVLMS
jgi:hypothetical protein